MHSTDSECLFRRLKHINERSSLSLSTKVAAGRVMNLTAQSGKLVLRLNDYKLSKNILEFKVSGKAVTVNVMK